MESIHDITNKIYGYCQALGVPRDCYPLVEREPLIREGVYFSNKPQYSFCVAERGKVIHRTVCNTAADMYYGILKILSIDIAIRTEARQRKVGEDPRRQIFSIQYELLKRIDDKFARMFLADAEKVLRMYPYNDNPFQP